MPILKRTGKPDLFYEMDDFTDPWKDAPYLVLQHGNGRSSRFWYSWVPYLSRFYRVIRPDMRGLGQSSRNFDLETELTVDECIADLAAIIDSLGTGTVHFCGESLGGILGLGLAAQYPEKIMTLTLVATPVFSSDYIRQTYAFEHGTRTEAMLKMGIREWVNATNRKTRFPPDTDIGLLDWYAMEFEKGDPDVLIRMARMVNKANATPYLPRVKSPVLGLYPRSGGKDTDLEQEQLLLTKLQNLRMIHIPTDYHMVQHIAPATCALHVLHFLAQHDGFPCHEP